MDEIDYTEHEGTRLKTESDTNNGNHKIVYDYFINKGLKPYQAVGIIGNLSAESYYDIKPDIENSIGAYGIAQWLGVRRKSLEKFATKNKSKVSNINTQLDFMWHEFNTTEKRAYKKLINSKTPNEAASVFAINYERPSTKELEDSMDKRIGYADEFYKKLYGEDFNYNTDTPINNKFIEYNEVTKDQIAKQTNNKMFLDMQKMLKNSNKDKEALEAMLKEDSNKKFLQDKLNKREMLKDMINNLDIKFVKSK